MTFEEYIKTKRWLTKMNAKEKALEYLIKVDKTKDVERDYLPEYYKYEIKAIELAIKEAKKEVFDDIENMFEIKNWVYRDDYVALKKRHLSPSAKESHNRRLK